MKLSDALQTWEKQELIEYILDLTKTARTAKRIGEDICFRCEIRNYKPCRRCKVNTLNKRLERARGVQAR